jgi:hypothetical protein
MFAYFTKSAGIEAMVSECLLDLSHDGRLFLQAASSDDEHLGLLGRRRADCFDGGNKLAQGSRARMDDRDCRKLSITSRESRSMVTHAV